MRISQIKLTQFRRFTDLQIDGIPEAARLVVIAGPNGSGKSSLFDALNLWYQINSDLGWTDDRTYYVKSGAASFDPTRGVDVRVFDGNPKEIGSFYFRSAYRNDPEFSLATLSRLGPAARDFRFRRMIEGDAAVTTNYQRLASQAFEDVFAKEDSETTIGAFREKVVGDIRVAVKSLFPDLTLNSLGNPLDEGTFRFDKGASKGFLYKNLSGGEKAAFDLILDIVVKRASFPKAIYCIDEPEAHMNSRLHGALLQQLLDLVPSESQLWVATHSIGMMRKAMELYERKPNEVAFLEFSEHDFDRKTHITPTRPTRAFWENVLKVALDDLSMLVAPARVVICEGSPRGAYPTKNAEHDARCYELIFANDEPNVKFLSGGNSSDVMKDRIGLAAALSKIATGAKIYRLVDRDDHSPEDVENLRQEGVTVLGRRNLESYLCDDEILTVLCSSVGKPEETANLLKDKRDALEASALRGNAPDDMKSVAGDIYVQAKRRLSLVAVGNDAMAFARNKLAPLVRPGTNVYSVLHEDVFGV